MLVSSITLRSIPMSIPPVGGIPYSIAFRKSSSSISVTLIYAFPLSHGAQLRLLNLLLVLLIRDNLRLLLLCHLHFFDINRT